MNVYSHLPFGSQRSASSINAILPSVVGNYSMRTLMQEKISDEKCWPASHPPIQRVWYRMRDSPVLRSDTAEGGLLWYYDEENDTMWYKIVESKTIPREAVEWLKMQEGVHKPFEEWIEAGFTVMEDFDNSIDESPSGSEGRFGMELEFAPSPFTLNLDALRKSAGMRAGEPVDEGDFKGKELFAVAGGRASMTPDSRVGYDDMGHSANITPELVFRAEHIHLNDDLEALGREIVESLRSTPLFRFAGEHQVPDTSGQTKITLKVETSGGQDLTGAVFDQFTSFGIHITVAIPLSLMGKRWFGKSIGRNIFSNSLDSGIEDEISYSGESVATMAFLAILKTLFKSAQSEPSRKADPKAGMKVMNRTSFGKMFTLLNEDDQCQVLRTLHDELPKRKVTETAGRDAGTAAVSERDANLCDLGPERLQEDEATTPVLTKDHPISLKQMYEFLFALYKGEKSTLDDPTYLANRGERAEKLGVSQLGDRTERIGDEPEEREAPILEFRAPGNYLRKLSDLPDYLRRVQEDLKKFLTR